MYTVIRSVARLQKTPLKYGFGLSTNNDIRTYLTNFLVKFLVIFHLSLVHLMNMQRLADVEVTLG